MLTWTSLLSLTCSFRSEDLTTFAVRHRVCGVISEALNSIPDFWLPSTSTKIFFRIVLAVARIAALSHCRPRFKRRPLESKGGGV